MVSGHAAAIAPGGSARQETSQQSTPEMLGHVEMRLRLVYELDQKALPDFHDCDESHDSHESHHSHHSLETAPLAREWVLAGMLPEDRSDDGESGNERYVTAPVALTLDRDEAEGYYLNLTSPEPSLFALLRGPATDRPDAIGVTASYAEAARWMDGGMVVVRCPLPAPLVAWLAAFTQHHYVTEGPRKKGSGPRPSFLSRHQFGEQSRAAFRELDGTDRVPVPDAGRRDR